MDDAKLLSPVKENRTKINIFTGLNINSLSGKLPVFMLTSTHLKAI